MPLAFRLLVVLSLVAASATAIVGLWVRDATRRQLERDFADRIEAAMRGARLSLEWEGKSMRDQLGPLCKHGTFVDQAHLEIEKARGDVSRMDDGARIALRHHVPDEARARNLDELALVMPDGFVLGSSDLAKIGTRDPRLGKLLAQPGGGPPHLRPGAVPPVLEVHCAHSERGITVGLVGARRVDTVLARVGEASGVELSVLAPETAEPKSDAKNVVRVMTVEGIGAQPPTGNPKDVAALRVVASMSRKGLLDALESLDRGILLSGATTVGLAVLLGILLARSLSRPIVALARETREVIAGQPRSVRSSGGREIGQLADAFNRTIDELAAMRRRLAVTERIAARREVARQVAHEIKNPLAPIRAAVETLRRLRARDDPAFDEYFDEATRTVLEEVHRITNIVGEFTKFARLPAPDPSPGDLVATARSVVTLHGMSSEPTGAPNASKPRVELVAEEIPEVRFDKDQLVQVLTNLVQNGIDAASAVREDPRVTVTIRMHDRDWVAVIVRDNGPGVVDEMLPRLFEPYATSKKHGTGLGLAIVQRIVFEHGGEITYRPAQKGGAVFEIRLPVGGPSPLEKPLEATGSTLTGGPGGPSRR